MRAVIKSRRAGTPTFAMRAPERLRPPKRTSIRTCHPPRRQTRSQEQPTRLMNDGDWGPDSDVQDIIESRERRRRQDRLELARRRSTQDRLLDSHDVDLNAPREHREAIGGKQACPKWRRSKEYRRTVQQSSPSHDRDDDGDEEYEEEDEHEEPEEEEPPQRPARPPSWAKKQKEAADLPAKKSTKKRIKEPPNTRSAVAPRRFLQIDLDLLRRKDMTLTERWFTHTSEISRGWLRTKEAELLLPAKQRSLIISGSPGSGWPPPSRDWRKKGGSNVDVEVTAKRPSTSF